MKKFYVSFEFLNLPGGVMYQTVQVDATNLGMACHVAFQEVKKRPGIKGRQIHDAKMKVVEIQKAG